MQAETAIFPLQEMIQFLHRLNDLSGSFRILPCSESSSVVRHRFLHEFKRKALPYHLKSSNGRANSPHRDRFLFRPKFRDLFQ